MDLRTAFVVLALFAKGVGVGAVCIDMAAVDATRR